MSETVEDAPVGRNYLVTFQDCCVSGSFTAMLTAKTPVPDEPGQFESVTFGNGVTLTEWLNVELTPVIVNIPDEMPMASVREAVERASDDQIGFGQFS